jgi:3',5'-cyclic AMP phosphodiesterase CpdA
VIVAWETDYPSAGAVVYGETDPHSHSKDAPQIDTRHAITLTGLSPYTVYHYQVLGGEEPLSDVYTFRTAAPLDLTSFTFVAFGDTRTQEQRHQEVVDLILTLEPDFVINTGDLVAHGHSNYEWTTFFQIEQELLARAPLFSTMGNHEANNPLYREIFYLPGNERWYSFDYGHAHFVCVHADGLWDRGPDDEQIDWLEADLAATEQPWKLVFFHIPPFSSRDEEEREVQVRQALVPTLIDQGVQVVFNGHDHNYQRAMVAGITYVVTGGGGAPLYTIDEPSPELITYASAHHAVLVTLDGPTLTAVAISAAGEELDRFTLELP